MIRKYATALLLLFFCASLTGLFAQGPETAASKDDWEEINFEFNYSVLTDGFPSLLRLAELLQKNPTYRVRVEGHTDQLGSVAYNDKLALARANTVRDFLLKYGAAGSQIETASRGKAQPKVNSTAPPSRFMNRRAVLTVTDGQGRVVSAGGVGDAIRAMEPKPTMADCCNTVLQKLDEVVAMLRDIKGENDTLRKELAALRDAQSTMRQEATQRASVPPPPPPPPGISKEDVKEVVNTALDASKTKRFSIIGLNAGPDTTGNISFTGKGRFFAPFGGSHAFQAEGEYLRYRDRQEGQFDAGLVNRAKNFQIGLFSSLKHVNLREYAAGGTLGQGAVTFDYIFKRGRIGAFGTKAYRDDVVIRRGFLTANIFEETYLKVVDQVGGSTQIGLHGNSYVEGNLGALFRRGGSNRPGGTVRFVQPLNERWAFTAEAGLNETLISNDHQGRIVFGVQLGNWMRPKEFRDVTHPVPVDIPRLRYEVLKRQIRTGNDPPVADAGADQMNAIAGSIVLDGSASFDPDNDPITYEWTQISGPGVALSGRNTARVSFTGVEGQTYAFRLTVRDDHGGQGVDRVAVMIEGEKQVKINRFTTNPTRIRAGESITLVWDILNADEAEISGLGRVDPKTGTSTLAPNETTVYKLTARNKTSEANETVTVVVDRPAPLILSFTGSPLTILAGENSTLTWRTQDADTVILSGVGNVPVNGSNVVSPNTTVTFTLTAKNRFSETNATVTIQVNQIPLPQIIRFTVNPNEVLSGEPATLEWQVENSTDITISGIGRVDANGNSTVRPTDNTGYVITARNARGEVSATVNLAVVQPVRIISFTATPTLTAKPGDPVTLTWSTQNATDVVIAGIGTVPANGSVTVNPTADASYNLLASNRRSQANASVAVRVTPATGPPPTGANRPPVANAGPDQDISGLLTGLDGSASFDPDGDPITYSWRVIGFQSAEIYAGTSSRPQVRFPRTGTYTLELTVTDSKGATGTDTVIITVQQVHG